MPLNISTSVALDQDRIHKRNPQKQSKAKTRIIHDPSGSNLLRTQFSPTFSEGMTGAHPGTRSIQRS